MNQKVLYHIIIIINMYPQQILTVYKVHTVSLDTVSIQYFLG